ncbi:membrane protein [Streptomyces sulfonofaciens]|uniref:Membrane protein n=1 Tax=Streptomyces sulfonofaciens TaxID=68272 RepID=A0A919GI66_9ACTN|nr:YoaK family protein [Streptomyces sulfonofaciens]GHH84450.1 membrane protein [Streptomyces sulfonofaciens]
MPTSAPDEEPEPHGRRPGGSGSAPHDGPGARGPRLLPVLLALTVVSGIIDAVSYLALGHVFTANMTGNVAVLGFAAAGAAEFSAAHALVSLAAFLAGSAAGGWAGQLFAGRARRTWLRVAFTAEAALLGAASAVSALAPDSSEGTEYALVAVTALAMGVRNTTVRRLGVADMTTTVLTMTLTGLAADSPLGGGRSVRPVRRLGSVLALLAGALLGGWLVLHHDLWLPLLIAAAMTGALVPTVSGRM